jgi:hypothetical protein
MIPSSERFALSSNEKRELKRSSEKFALSSNEKKALKRSL